MGDAIAKITINPGEAILERDGKKVSAIDADTLIQNTLGLPLPARGLSNWLNGQLRAGSPARLERDNQGQVKRISQDGWDLAYVWNESKKIERLTMTRNTNTGSIDVRLIFDQVNE
jgi:outer membrane biogenesis lipoprotein LolB